MGIFFLIIGGTLGPTGFIYYDIGPANEVSCLIKQVENPTFFTMATFIAIDSTDNNVYTPEYVCHHFTTDLIAQAQQQGIQAGYVTLHHKPTGHALVAFKTTDRGLYFVEPQSDILIPAEQMQAMMETGVYRSDPQNPTGIPFTHYSINWFYGI